MRGDLSETSAADACRQLAGEGLSGTLAIAGPDGPGGIVFAGGRVLAATSPTPRARLGDRLVGAGFLEQEQLDEALAVQRAAEGQTRLGALLVERDLVPNDAVRLFVQEQLLDALFEIVSWRFGAFEFRSAMPAFVPEVTLLLPVDDALVEVARRQQEWHELSQVIPDLDAVPTFSDQASAAASLEPDEFAVLASLDGDRSVRALAADLGYGEFELARIVYGLTLLGVVEVQLPQDEVGAALDDALSRGPTRASGTEPADRPRLAPVPDAAASGEHDLEPDQRAEAGEGTSMPEARLVRGDDSSSEAEETPTEPIHASSEAEELPTEPDRSSPEAEEEPTEPGRASPEAEEEPALRSDGAGAASDVEVRAASDEPAADDDPTVPGAESHPDQAAATELADSGQPTGATERGESEGSTASTPDPGAVAEPAADAGLPDRPDPSFSDVLREFRSMDALHGASVPSPPQRPAASRPGTAGTHDGERRAASSPPASDGHEPATSGRHEPAASDRHVPDVPAGYRPAPRAPEVDPTDAPAAHDRGEARTSPSPPPAAEGESTDDADVSEFLRELSRLSGEKQPPAPPKPPRPRKPETRDDGDEGKRRKRGLFGWGG